MQRQLVITKQIKIWDKNCPKLSENKLEELKIAWSVAYCWIVLLRADTKFAIATSESLHCLSPFNQLLASLSVMVSGTGSWFKRWLSGKLSSSSEISPFLEFSLTSRFEVMFFQLFCNVDGLMSVHYSPNQKNYIFNVNFLKDYDQHLLNYFPNLKAIFLTVFFGNNASDFQ